MALETEENMGPKQLALPLISVVDKEKINALWNANDAKYLVIYRDHVKKEGMMIRKIFCGENFIHDIIDYVSHIPGYAWCLFRFSDNIESETSLRKYICSLGVAITRHGMTKFEHYCIEMKLK